MEEGNESIGVGQRISVNVETLFKDGFVVSFTDADGVEYRGALLSPVTVVGSGRGQCRSQTVPFVRAPNSTLANPLSYLHDHPYSNMKKYGKKLTTAMPADVLLQWNSVPSVTIYPAVSEPNHAGNGVASRSQRSLKDQTGNDTTIHATSIDVPELASGFPTYIPGLVRHAKFVAHMRMKVNLEEQNGTGSVRRSRSCDPPQSKRYRRSTSPVLKKHKRRHKSPNYLVKETTPPSMPVLVPTTSPIVPLKDFSIRVSKVAHNGITTIN